MELKDVLRSELREEALRRAELAKQVARRVGGVIYGSMAAMIAGGLPRLPRDADIAVGDARRLGELFWSFEREGWHQVELVRQPPSVWRNGGPRYTLILWEAGYRFFVTLSSRRLEPNQTVDGVGIHLSRDEYVREKREKLLSDRATILDLLDLLWFGEDVNPASIPAQVAQRIVRDYPRHLSMIPRENMPTAQKILIGLLGSLRQESTHRILSAYVRGRHSAQ